MGLGLIFPLLLILNLRMDPGVAGLRLIPTTLPMVILAPLTGRWYDRSGGRVPMTFGFVILAVSGVLLAITVSMVNYLWLLPGLLTYGAGLAIVLTVNDPVRAPSARPTKARRRAWFLVRRTDGATSEATGATPHR